MEDKWIVKKQLWIFFIFGKGCITLIAFEHKYEIFLLLNKFLHNIHINYKFLAKYCKTNFLLIRSDAILAVWGTTSSRIFFVQPVLVEECFHRRELQLVSSDNYSNVEWFQIKKVFFEYRCIPRSYRGLKIWNKRLWKQFWKNCEHATDFRSHLLHDAVHFARFFTIFANRRWKV